MMVRRLLAVVARPGRAGLSATPTDDGQHQQHLNATRTLSQERQWEWSWWRSPDRVYFFNVDNRVDDGSQQ
jgi:hypothetical protein